MDTKRYTTKEGECLFCKNCIEHSNCEAECNAINICIKKLSAYETAEEEGRLVVLPCKVGDTVHVLRQSWNGWNIDKEKFTYRMIGKFGKTVFLARGEAEKALKEMEGKLWANL